MGYRKGCAPLLDVQKICVPSCCFSVPYLGIILGFCSCEKVCVKFVDFERFFCTNPVHSSFSFFQLDF